MLIMLLCKGSSLAVARGRGFISIIKSSARVESLGTALASTTLQAKPAWARGKLALGGEEKKKVKVHSSSPFQ